MVCPRCKLINPESAKRCDCGYDFESNKVERAYFTQAFPKELKIYLIGTLTYNVFMAFLIVIFAISFYFPWLVGILVAITWSVSIWVAYWQLLNKKNRARIAMMIITFPYGIVFGLSSEVKLYCLQKRNW